MAKFKKLHEQRVSLYVYYEAEYMTFLRSYLIEQASALLGYEVLLKSVALEMNQINQGVRELKATALAQGLESFAAILDAVQIIERDKFQLTAHAQLSLKATLFARQYAEEDLATINSLPEFTFYVAEKHRLHALINEQLDELQCLLD